MAKLRLYYMDYLRVIAIIGVLAIHAAAPYVSMYQKIPDAPWAASIVYNGLVRWCVPIFLMVSGALLLNRPEEPLGDFFKRRANRILLPFVIWSVIYYTWKQIIWADGAFHIGQFFTLFLKNGIYYHLWYFYALIGIYLLVPMLSIFANHASKQIVGYIVGLYFIFYGGFRYYAFLMPNTLASYFPFTEMIGLFLLGFYFGKFEQAKRTRIVIYIAGFVGAIATVWRTFDLTISQGAFSSYAYSYSSPAVMAQAIAIFVAVKYMLQRIQVNPSFKPSRLTATISTASFGVYLIHPMLLDVLRTYFHDGTVLLINPVIGIPLQVIILLIICTILVAIILRIPYVRRIF